MGAAVLRATGSGALPAAAGGRTASFQVIVLAAMSILLKVALLRVPARIMR